MFTPFAILFGKVLGFIYQAVPNYGLAIILFTLLTKALMFPLSYRQLKMSKEMSKIQPLIKEIQDKYRNDRETQNRKILELYKEHNYNPFSGCLPMIINFILVIGLFSALRSPEQYVFASEELVIQATHQPFLWIPNLSLPDTMNNIIRTGEEFLLKLPGLMPIISAALTYVSMVMTPMTPPPPQATGPKDQKPPQPSSMTIMKYLMPGMILLYGTSLSAGLVLYWTVGNAVQIAQQAWMNRLKNSEEMN